MPIVADHTQSPCEQGTPGTGTPVEAGNIPIVSMFVPVNWFSAITPAVQVKNYLNALAVFPVEGQLYCFYSFKVTFSTKYQSQFRPQIHKWFFKPGNGTYGQGGTESIEVSDLLYIGYHQDPKANNVISLGEIGTVAIKEYINTSGPYSVSVGGGVFNVFEAKSEGNPISLLYLGKETLVGDGQYQLKDEDIKEFNGEVVHAEEAFVTSEELADSMFNNFNFSEAANLSDFTTLTEKFYVLKVINEANNFYFASKSTNIEDFSNSKLYIKYNNKAFDLGLPNAEMNGYKFWSLGNMEVDFQPEQNYAFDFWIKNRADSDSVKFSLQNLSAQQQNQARENIGVNFTAPTIPDWAQQLIDQLNF